MLRHFLLAASIGLFAGPLAAQVPDGWKVRIDRSQNAQDPDDTPNLKFVAMGTGFRVTSGPGATFWHPAHTATGDYTVKATFTLMKPSGHVNYYGLIFGGSDIEGAGQNYLYFLIGQNGSYVVRHRAGGVVQDVQERTLHDAIRQPDAKGQSTNALEVRVSGTTISYVVNGTVVLTTPKTGMNALQAAILPVQSVDRGADDPAAETRRFLNAIRQATARTDGLVGIRVSHLLDVQIEGLEVQKR